MKESEKHILAKLYTDLRRFDPKLREIEKILVESKGISKNLWISKNFEF